MDGARGLSRIRRARLQKVETHRGGPDRVPKREPGSPSRESLLAIAPELVVERPSAHLEETCGTGAVVAGLS